MLNYIWMFFVYSFVGWLNEVVLIRISSGRFVNRGFLIGPYCPVYGTGGVLITLFLTKYQGDCLVIFGMSMLLCTILEYVVSWMMEVLFHARWWDYSEKPMNINGRVWIGNACLFGIAGVLVIEGVNPIFFHFLSCFSIHSLRIFAFLLILGISFDFVFSFVTIYHFRHLALELTQDATEEIVAMVKLETQELKEHIRNDVEIKARKLFEYQQQKASELRERFNQKNFLHRRLMQAYPHFELRNKKIKQMREEIHQHFHE